MIAKSGIFQFENADSHHTYVSKYFVEEDDV